MWLHRTGSIQLLVSIVWNFGGTQTKKNPELSPGVFAFQFDIELDIKIVGKLRGFGFFGRAFRPSL